MDYQVLFNIALGVAAMVIGWYMKGISDSIKELRVKDDSLVDAVSRLAISIPENYVHKHDFKDLSEALFKKLDRIEDKLDNKADK
jgi:hypothetical protein